MYIVMEDSFQSCKWPEREEKSSRSLHSATLLFECFQARSVNYRNLTTSFPDLLYTSILKLNYKYQTIAKIIFQR